MSPTSSGEICHHQPKSKAALLQSVQSRPAAVVARRIAARVAVGALRTPVAQQLAEGRTRQAAAGRRTCPRRLVADPSELAVVARTLGAAAAAQSRLVWAGRPLADRSLLLQPRNEARISDTCVVSRDGLQPQRNRLWAATSILSPKSAHATHCKQVVQLHDSRCYMTSGLVAATCIGWWRCCWAPRRAASRTDASRAWLPRHCRRQPSTERSRRGAEATHGRPRR